MTGSADNDATSAPLSPPPASSDEVESPVRPRTGLVGRLAFGLGVVIALWHLYANTYGTLPTLWQNALHFAGFALLCTLVFPAVRLDSSSGRLAVLWFDGLLGILVALAAVHVAFAEDAIFARGVNLAPLDWVAGIVVILGAIEFTRRTTGWIIPVLIFLGLSYITWLGPWLPGTFSFGGLSLETILFRTLYADEGLFGTIARISSSIVFMFMLFGAFLMRSGAADFIIDLARCLAGRFTGGPALVAVIASALTGTISGSAVANTASTGVITIPLMKRAGFRGRFAGGVEAAASTGGQVMPPIMGAGAFVMANYTQISYTTIIAAAALPALLYFLTVAYFVRIEAKRLGLQADSADAPRLADVLKRGGLTFVLPIGVLIGMLIAGYTPTFAACTTILVVIAASWLSPTPMGPRAILDALATGARNMIMTAVLLVAIGILINVILTTGVGNTFSLMIADWASGSLLIAIVLIALASLVLGMGLPVTAAYIVLAPLSAPALHGLILDSQILAMMTAGTLPDAGRMLFALVDPMALTALAQPMPAGEAQALLNALPLEALAGLRDQLIDPAVVLTALLSAHMIIFWLSQDSNVTPPVCLAAFTAAAIAKAPAMATGFDAWRIAKGLYIVPLLFAFTPLLGGTFWQVAEILLFAAIGLYALGGALQGFLETRILWVERVLLLAAGTAMLWPDTYSRLAGTMVFAAVFAWSLRRR